MERRLHIVGKDDEPNEEEIESEDLQSEEESRGGGKKTLLLIGVVLLLVLLVVLVVHFGKSRTYEGYTVLCDMNFRQVGETEVFAYKDGFLYVLRDGTVAVDSDGKKLWNVTYDMKSPRAAVEGDCAAIGDRGNRRLYICDGTGSVNNIDVPYPIVDVDISSECIAAVWTNAELEDHVYLYDINGTMLLDIMTTARGSGFPLDISLSPDGRKLVTSYVNVESGNTVSWVTFYNFGGVGQSYVDKIVGTFSYESDIVPRVEFPDNDKVAVLRQNEAEIFSYREIPELSAMIEPEGRIKSIFFDGADAIGFVLEKGSVKEDEDTGKTDGKVTEEEEKSKQGSYEIETYSLSGSRIGRFEMSGDYTGIAGKNGSIFVYGPAFFKVYSSSGVAKYSGSDTQGIREILPVTDRRLVLFEDSRVRYIELY